MRVYRKKFLGLVVLMAVLLISNHVLAQEQSQEDQTAIKKEVSIEIPNLDEIIPLASQLTSRLAAIENKVTTLLDVSAVEKIYSEIEVNLKVLPIDWKS